ERDRVGRHAQRIIEKSQIWQWRAEPRERPDKFEQKNQAAPAAPLAAHYVFKSPNISFIRAVCFFRSAINSRRDATTSGGALATKSAFANFFFVASSCFVLSATCFSSRFTSAAGSMRPTSDTYASNSGVTCDAACFGFATFGPHSSLPTPASSVM